MHVVLVVGLGIFFLVLLFCNNRDKFDTMLASTKRLPKPASLPNSNGLFTDIITGYYIIFS